MIIYSVTNLINGKIYIGQTIKSLKTRWACHKNKGDALYNAIMKYGHENFQIEQIDSANTLEELNKKEINWIQQLNTVAPLGYNIRLGGNSGGKLSDETKKKLSIAGKGKKHSDSWKKMMSERNSGVNNPMYGKSPNWGKECSKETREKISRANLGKKRSEESIRKTAAAKTGKRMSTKRQYTFDVYNKDTNEFIGTWKNQKSCAIDLGIHVQNINKCLKKVRNSVGNYKFIVKGEK